MAKFFDQKAGARISGGMTSAEKCGSFEISAQFFAVLLNSTITLWINSLHRSGLSSPVMSRTGLPGQRWLWQ